MSFQWLQLRIGEEKERREREAQVLARMPSAIDELEQALKSCLDEVKAALGAHAVRLSREALNLRIHADGGAVDVVAVLDLPGIEVQRNGAARRIQVGVLPGDRVFYLDMQADQYLTMDELTKLILDRVLFPKLKE